MFARSFDKQIWWWAAVGPVLLLLTLLIRWFVEPTLWAFGFVCSAGFAIFTTYFVFKEARGPIAHLRREQTSLQADLSELRAEYLDYRREAERQQRIERIKMTELAALQEERNALLLEVLQPPDHHLFQLRKQFEEKDEVLHQTRVQLWHAESDMLRMHHEREAATIEPDPNFTALDEPFAVAARAEEEIEALEGVITTLLEELKSRSVPSLSGFQLQNQ